MLKGKVETIKTRLKSMQGMNPAFATGHKLGLIDVSMFVSLARVDERSRISPSLPRLRWRRFWHACCIVGATAHVPRLHFSGDHLEDVWRLLRGTFWSARVLYVILRRFAIRGGCHGMEYSYCLLAGSLTHVVSLLVAQDWLPPEKGSGTSEGTFKGS
jgi:hypothetical protein